MQKRLTIVDIAKEAGVSVATVSRVLSNQGNVTKKTTAAVKLIIEKYNFRQNMMAKAFKEQRTHTIGFIAPYIINPYFSTIFNETQRLANEQGKIMYFCNTWASVELESRYLQTLMDNRVEAIVVMGGRTDQRFCERKYIDELREIAKHIPLILTMYMPEVDCVQVFNDDTACMEIVLEHLVQKGHRDIALIGGSEFCKPSYNRKQSFKNYLEHCGCVVKKEWIIESENSDVASGISCMKQLLSQNKLPTAVCGINDLTAIGAMNCTQKRGLAVPKDIAIAGCDGISFDEIISPSLTSVSTDYTGFGRAITDAIMNYDKYMSENKYIKLGMRLIVGEST